MWAIVMLIVGILAIWFIFLYPIWSVWASMKSGEAKLEEAKFAEQVARAQADARLSAAKINKEAAIIEAEAVSEQIQKIGKQLTSHDLYLKWQWIKMMEERPEASTIYIPTEAGMPILEAGMKRKKTEVEVEEEIDETE
jgi:regulator of protease activity HflC (stomatin/prohibitin superfamily)